ncbi:MAG TPA: NAD(P)/FAD-dependent oxidoreductase [Candidatus Ligilactobacillus excrementavium]|nr:NAD(P)/FAD-dependent oxidoreductase [Candidatus Ligilactobacillus excrementavium]
MEQLAKKYDAVVIGAGPAGTAAASAIKSKGQKVALVEEDLWGGTCPNRGCDPKKILYTAVEAKKKAELLTNNGLNSQITLDWPALMANKRAYTKEISPATKKGMENSQIQTYVGHAEFVADTTLQVGEQLLEANNFVIATGQRPGLLDIPGREFLKTSTDFLDLDDMPADVTIIGGGYVAFELAGIAVSTGAKVTVLVHNSRPLKAFPQKLVTTLVEQLSNQGVKFVFDQNVTEVESMEKGYRIHGENDYQQDTDMVFAAVGRQPNVDDLGLTQAGVEYSKQGVIVDRHLRSTAAHIYAVGDAAASPIPKLTPVAGIEAKYVAAQIAGRDDEITYPLVPTVVFSLPKLAQVGMTESQAQKDSARYQVKVVDMTGWITYKRQHETKPLVQLIIDKMSGLVVGGACLSMEADEMINYLTVLIGEEYTAKKVKHILWSYPTTASDLQYIY